MPDLRTFAAELAQSTGELLLQYYQNPQTETTLKPDHTILTEADLAADRHITSIIRQTFPNDYILSEELETRYPASNQPTWVIDPLDGTSNFALGVHYWGISIARILDGWPEIAALYFPVIGELYTAQRGQGAEFNQIPIRPNLTPHPVSFFTCDSRVYRHYQVKVPYKARMLGSAAYNFCAVARGISALGFETTPRVWDIAASWLVLKEAGGTLQFYEDELFPLKPGMDYKHNPYPVLGTGNDEMLNKAKHWILPKEK